VRSNRALTIHSTEPSARLTASPLTKGGESPDAQRQRVHNNQAMTNPPERPYRRLTLSVNNKMLAGVCGGIAEYFGVDPTLVRLAAVVLALLGGSGLFIYGVAWIIMPKP